jgi:hypothetical protein
MDQHRKAALEIIHEYYYALPNNGYLNHGLLSCDKRYKEATQCALIGVKRIILILEFMSTESNDPAIMGRINFYDKVQDELYKIQANNHKMKLNELPTSSEYEINEDEAVAYFERAEKINKAREYSSPLIEELINETTPEELAKIDAEMTNNKQHTAVEWLEKICNDRGYYLMSEYFQQAKEMDKERMIGFTNKYINEELWVNCNAIESDSTVEQYYNETYGGNK